MRFVLLLAVVAVSRAPSPPCRCLPTNTGHVVGVGRAVDAMGRTITEYGYGCDLGSGERTYAIACVTQRSGQTSCACKRDGVTLRTAHSRSPFPDPRHAIDACRFPS